VCFVFHDVSAFNDFDRTASNAADSAPLFPAVNVNNHRHALAADCRRRRKKADAFPTSTFSPPPFFNSARRSQRCQQQSDEKWENGFHVLYHFEFGPALLL